MILNAIGIEAGEERWNASHLRRSGAGKRAERDFTLEGSLEQRAAGLREYAERKRLFGLRVCVALPPGSYVSRTIELPAAGKGSLRGMLAFELEKHLPSDPSGWAYSSEVLDRGPRRQLALLSAAPTEAADRLINALACAGQGFPFLTTAERAVGKALSHSGTVPLDGSALLSLRADGAHITAWSRPERPCYSRTFKASGPGAFERELRFASMATEGALGRCLLVCESGEDVPLREDARKAARALGLEIVEYGGREATAVSVSFGAALLLLDRKARAADLAPERKGGLKARGAALTAAGGALGLALLLPAFFLVNEAVTLRRLDRALAELGPERGRAQALGAALAEIESDIKAIREVRGDDAPGFLEVLTRLTEATPSDTYLTGMEYDRKTLVVEGASGKASGLFLALERSGIAKDIEFDGPVTAGPDGRERFRINLRLDRGTEASASARK